MRSLLVCICGLIPLFSLANDAAPFEISGIWGSLATDGTNLFSKKQIITFDDADKLNIQFNLSSDAYRQGDLLFNYYQRQFKPIPFQQQAENKITLHYLHLGGSVPISNPEGFWLSAGFGVTYFATQNSQFDDETKLSVSLGLHRNFKINERLSFSFESMVLI
ncbi:MAG: hypothetical protein JKX90_07330 [Colwellia sp.]|jgi:hypothetical protein|nr:hypothetical protein [Colwellia sp.]